MYFWSFLSEKWNNKLQRMITDKDRIELELNYLAYSRYVSMAHTIFSSCFEITLAIIFGTIGIVLSLVEIGYIIEFNTYYFLRTLSWSGVKMRRSC